MAAAFALCLILMVYAGERIYGTIGPSRAMATADGRLYLLSHGKLHLFDANGLRTSVVDLKSLGVPVRPSDFEVHRDGRLVTTDPDDSVLHRCNLPSGPCERLEVGLATTVALELRAFGAAKLHIDDDAKRYYISDNSGHSLVIADFSGRALAKLPAGQVSYPNQLAVYAPGELTVVATGNRSLVTYDVKGDRFGARLREMDTRPADKIARSARRLPFDSVRLPNGETWVLIAREGMKDADVIAFDAQGNALRRIGMGTSDPFDIEVWRGRVWSADATHYTFESVGFDGEGRAEIEDAGFRRELAEARESPARWRKIRMGTQIALVAIPLLGILILRRK